MSEEKYRFNRFLPLLIQIVFFLGSLQLSAQCTSIPNLECEKVFDGLLVSNRYQFKELNSLGSVDFNVPFYGGQVYKMYLCAEDQATTFFKVVDDEGNLLYDSKEQSNEWLFELEYLQLFKIVVYTTRKSEADSKQSNCGALMVGVAHLVNE